ncbi:hypothetical protein LZC95_26715 [Pendulispora brunnea]|uniref:Uncharacterized protein n=1 Tax=Pendulispora brunnea TaxID=2905690 RepID=A0ABZ2JUP9_9BACT
MLAFLIACRGPAAQVRALPPHDTRVIAPSVSKVLALPARGEMTRAVLGDGTPVWLVHHVNDAVTIVVPFAPLSRGKGGGPFAPLSCGEGAAMVVVPWDAETKQFAGTFRWDAFGHVLGNSGWDACMGPCPPIASLPTRARDLDTFVARRLEGDPNHVEVGDRVAGVTRDIPQEPIWPPRPHRSGDPSRWPETRQISVAAALAQPEGTMVVVDGDIVLRDGDAPRICPSSRGHKPCPPDSPRVYDCDGEPERSVHGVETRFGPVYTRRFRDGFVQATARGGFGSALLE